jgi:hypothetical protein
MGRGGEAEELGQLADQHHDGEAVEVANADRTGEELGNGADPGYSCQCAHDSHDQGQRARQGDRLSRVAVGGDQR